MDKKPYFEGYFAVEFNHEDILFAPISELAYRLMEGRCAEVNIPYTEPEAGYTMICMLGQLAPDYLAWWEMAQLKQIVEYVVTEHREHFHEVMW